MNVYSIGTNKLTYKSHIKVTFWCSFMCFVLLGLAIIAVSAIRPDALMINGRQATGIVDGVVAFFLSLLIGGIFSFIWAVIGASLVRIFGIILPLGLVSFKDKADL
ncbi:MAG: hypothetical protein ACPGVT_05915 [Maricaulaceae bacterium]